MQNDQYHEIEQKISRDLKFEAPNQEFFDLKLKGR
jgi:hypothetical protein